MLRQARPQLEWFDEVLEKEECRVELWRWVALHYGGMRGHPGCFLHGVNYMYPGIGREELAVVLLWLPFSHGGL